MERIERGGRAEEEHLLHRLIDYNRQFLTDHEELTYCMRDHEGNILAGIAASRDMDAIYVKYLFVEQACRGQGYGSALLKTIEDAARERDVRRIVLNTYSFQAPEFYRAHGYAPCGAIEPYAGEHGFYSFVKEL